MFSKCHAYLSEDKQGDKKSNFKRATLSNNANSRNSIGKQTHNKNNSNLLDVSKNVNAWECVSKQRDQLIENSFRFAFEVPLRIPLRTKLYRVKFSYSENPSTLGQWIRKVRVENDLFAHEVAKMVGCHRTSLLNWERDHTRPTEYNLEKLKKVLPQLEKMLIPQ